MTLKAVSSTVFVPVAVSLSLMGDDVGLQDLTSVAL